MKEVIIKNSVNIQQAIKVLMAGKDLSRTESRLVMNEIMENKASDAQISAYLVALRMKGATVDEITGSVQAVSEKTKEVKFTPENIVDISGTGGDNLNAFNISTTASFVAAGAGVYVAKHGQHSTSDRCGSADVLTELGVDINISKKLINKCFKEAHLAFLFAPKYQKSLGNTFSPRREIGARTLFNILKTVNHPASIKRQVIGVYDKSLMHTLMDVMIELQAEQVMIVHGNDGLDEISISAKTNILELIDGQVYEYEISPENFYLKSAPVSTIQSGSCVQSKNLLLDVLKGKEGPARDIVLLNSAATIKVSGVVETLNDGIELAKKSIESGDAYRSLQNMIEITNQK